MKPSFARITILLAGFTLWMQMPLLAESSSPSKVMIVPVVPPTFISPIETQIRNTDYLGGANAEPGVQYEAYKKNNDPFYYINKDGKEYRVRTNQVVIVNNTEDYDRALSEAKSKYQKMISSNPEDKDCNNPTGNSGTIPPHGNLPPTGGGGAIPDPSTASPALAGGIINQAGAVRGGATDIRTVNKNALSQFQNAAQLAQNARINGLSDHVFSGSSAIQSAARADLNALENLWKNDSPSSLTDRFRNAASELDQAAKQLAANPPAGTDAARLAADRNALLNARDKALAAQELLAQNPNSPLINNPDNALARNQALADLFGAAKPGSADAQADRLIMLMGLPKDKRNQALENLRLVENLSLKLPGGRTLRIPVTHTGPFDPKDKSCEALIGSLLFTDARKWTYTTVDLEAMWIHQRVGKLPTPPVFKGERAKVIKKTAQAFKAIHVYLGEKPASGDLLVYHLPKQPLGQVYLVRNYNADTMQVKAYAADSTGRRIKEDEFNLSYDPEQFHTRTVRPGLTVLRPNPENNAACAYADNLPASPVPASPASRKRGAP